MKKFYLIMKFLVSLPVKLIYPTKIIGKEKLTKDANIIISNHLSFRDIPIVGVATPGFKRFMAKKEFERNPFLRFIFGSLGAIFVDRGNLDINAIRNSLASLKEGNGLIIFPEGTRNRVDENIMQVKGGAAMLAIKGKVPIIPVIFQRKSRPFCKTYVYVSDPIYLDDFFGARLSAENLDKATAIIAKIMADDKEYIDDYVKNKRWKENRQQKKRNKKVKVNSAEKEDKDI